MALSPEVLDAVRSEFAHAVFWTQTWGLAVRRASGVARPEDNRYRRMKKHASLAARRFLFAPKPSAAF